MAKETLRAQVFSVDGTTISKPSLPHVIDHSLNTPLASFRAKPWSSVNGDFAVVWSSIFDFEIPVAGLTTRGKLAILTPDTVDPTGLAQHTWDLPIDIPADMPAHNRINIERLEDTDKAIVAGGGDINEAPILYSPNTETKYRDDFTIAVNEFQTSPTVNATVIHSSVGTVSSGYDSGSAVALDNGQVMYAWADNATSGSKISIGYADSVATFATTADSLNSATPGVPDSYDLITGLLKASCTLFRSSYDNEIYLIWSSDGPGSTPLTYATGKVVCTNPATGAIIQGPWTVIFRFNPGTGIWTIHGTVQSPGLVRNSFTTSWLAKTSFDALANAANPEITSCTLTDNSGFWDSRNFAEPHINDRVWTMPGTAYTWFESTTTQGAFYKTAGPTLWRSVNNGVTWTSLIPYASVPRFGSQESPIIAGNSRNYAFYNNKGWWAANSQKYPTANGGQTRIYDDANIVATIHYDTNFPPSPNFMSARDANGTSFLYTLFPEEYTGSDTGPSRPIKVYTSGNSSTLGDLSGITVMPDALQAFLSSAYIFADGWRQGTIVQRVGDYLMIIANGQVAAVPITDHGAYKGVYAYVVDKCSAESIW